MTAAALGSPFCGSLMVCTWCFWITSRDLCQMIDIMASQMFDPMSRRTRSLNKRPITSSPAQNHVQGLTCILARWRLQGGKLWVDKINETATCQELAAVWESPYFVLEEESCWIEWMRNFWSLLLFTCPSENALDVLSSICALPTRQHTHSTNIFRRFCFSSGDFTQRPSGYVGK